MTTFFKAVRPNGRDFFSDSIDYGAALVSGEVLRHPAPHKRRDLPSTYFSVSVKPAETLYGSFWPARLFRVEPVGSVMGSSVFKHKRAVSALRVIEELPAWQVFGPNGREVAAVVQREALVTLDEDYLMYLAATALVNTRSAARRRALDTALLNARIAAFRVVSTVGWNAGYAYVVRDLITESDFQALAGPWLSVIGDLEVE